MYVTHEIMSVLTSNSYITRDLINIHEIDTKKTLIQNNNFVK